MKTIIGNISDCLANNSVVNTVSSNDDDLGDKLLNISINKIKDPWILL